MNYMHDYALLAIDWSGCPSHPCYPFMIRLSSCETWSGAGLIQYVLQYLQSYTSVRFIQTWYIYYIYKSSLSLFLSFSLYLSSHCIWFIKRSGNLLERIFYLFDRIFHLFERFTNSSERIFYLFERLPNSSERIFYLFERFTSSFERILYLFGRFTNSSERTFDLFERIFYLFDESFICSNESFIFYLFERFTNSSERRIFFIWPLYAAVQYSHANKNLKW